MRWIFARFLEIGSCTELARKVTKRGLRTPRGDRIRELVDGNLMLERAAAPVLRAREELRKELDGLEKLLRDLARTDPDCRLMMTMPGAARSWR